MEKTSKNVFLRLALVAVLTASLTLTSTVFAAPNSLPNPERRTVGKGAENFVPNTSVADAKNSLWQRPARPAVGRFSEDYIPDPLVINDSAFQGKRQQPQKAAPAPTSAAGSLMSALTGVSSAQVRQAVKMPNGLLSSLNNSIPMDQIREDFLGGGHSNSIGGRNAGSRSGASKGGARGGSIGGGGM